MNTPAKVLCLYFENDTMGTEASLAFEKNGHTVLHEKLPVMPNGRVIWDPVPILSRVIQEKPQIIFIVNVFGVDPQCDLLRAFSLLGVKTALWFIDNPFYLYDHLCSLRKLKNVTCLIWDRFYMDPMKKFGLPKVHYLPQGTNPERFYEKPLAKGETSKFSHPLTFAGNLDVALLQELIQDWEKDNPQHSALLKTALLEMSLRILKEPTTPSNEIVQRVIELGNPQQLPLSEKSIYGLARIAESRLSIMLRIEMVKSLGDFDLALWGEASAWEISKVKGKILGRVSYFENMQKVANGTQINLNVSRIQQRYGTNQRVFDIPACNAFLLTDHKLELEEMFDLGTELITYKNFDDLRDKVAYYRDHEKERKEIAERGLAKVLSKHTYAHRMKDLVTLLAETPLEQETQTTPENQQAHTWIQKAKTNRSLS